MRAQQAAPAVLACLFFASREGGVVFAVSASVSVSLNLFALLRYHERNDYDLIMSP